MFKQQHAHILLLTASAHISLNITRSPSLRPSSPSSWSLSSLTVLAYIYRKCGHYHKGKDKPHPRFLFVCLFVSLFYMAMFTFSSLNLAFISVVTPSLVSMSSRYLKITIFVQRKCLWLSSEILTSASCSSASDKSAIPWMWKDNVTKPQR